MAESEKSNLETKISESSPISPEKKTIRKTRKIPCPKGTRWVEKAKRCLSLEEKIEFQRENRRTKKRNIVLEKTPDILESSSNNEIQTPSNPVILLGPKQKKCPPHYIQKPPKSGICVLNTKPMTSSSNEPSSKESSSKKSSSNEPSSKESSSKELSSKESSSKESSSKESSSNEPSSKEPSSKELSSKESLSIVASASQLFSSIFENKENTNSKSEIALSENTELKPLSENLEKQNILLNQNQKKCPKNYTQHPPNSRICVPNEKLQKNKTRKIKEKNVEREKKINTILKKSTVPEMILDESIQHTNIQHLNKTQLEGEDFSQEMMDESEEIKPEDALGTPESLMKAESLLPEELSTPESFTVKKTENDDFHYEKNQHDLYQEMDSSEYDALYPDQNDPHFNIKIYQKKEFSDYTYNGEIHDVLIQSKKECESSFEILPHQQFVKNFLSLQTPYNSLLLYHDLGTGKTCSAIGITEEMRMYMKQVGIRKKILIVASPNVQSNFRLQLFDSSKLMEFGKVGSQTWNLETCVGNALLNEINPTHLSGMTREMIVKKINSIIHDSYEFIGYHSLANFIEKTANVENIDQLESPEKEKDIHLSKQIRQLQRAFNDRLIVIDEVHNIIGKEDNDNKRTSNMLVRLVKHCRNVRLLFLSATPMYNSHLEIIWLLNIMNLNDQRSTISSDQIFDKNGQFVEEVKDKKTGLIVKESGSELLKRKLIGYVSYVRGENPYSFPYRIYPSVFTTTDHQINSEVLPYPKKQMNGFAISVPLKYIQVYMNGMGEYQKIAYKLAIQRTMELKKGRLMDFQEKESFGYTDLQTPISLLNIVYPNIKLDHYLQENKKEQLESSTFFSGGAETESLESKEESELDPILSKLHGIKGLESVIQYKSQQKPFPLAFDFEYKKEIQEKYGRIFQKENIAKYSGKIANICSIIEKSTGIILIYSKYIEGGLIPMALALEEMGFSRYGYANYTQSLWKTPPSSPLNPLTMKPKLHTDTHSAKYVMITGQKMYSPNNNLDLKLVTDSSNKYGEKVKVILISEAGSEGLDFKNIRQVHILDPWYNMNRIEQIIGRAVRNKSHCSLPFEERNVEIYMHGTYLDANEETADMYLYRLAERKAISIGKVTRLLKETAVDCLLNMEQTNFREDKMAQQLKLVLSTNRQSVNFEVGDKPFTNICDYMESCDFSCKPSSSFLSNTPKTYTYGSYFLQNNHDRISKRIRQLFREKSFYSWKDLLQNINIVKPYPLEQIYYTLSVFLQDSNEWIVDKYGRKGYMVHEKETYAFQPIEIKDERASIFERTNPIEYKKHALTFQLPTVPFDVLPPPLPTPSKATQQLEKMGMTLSKPPEKNGYDRILADLEKNIQIVLNKDSYIKPSNTDMNWYKYAKLAFRVLIDKHKISRIHCIQHIVFHFLDSSSLEQKYALLQHLFININDIISISIPEVTDTIHITDIIRIYFLGKMFREKKDTVYIVLAEMTEKESKNIYYHYDRHGHWVLFDALLPMNVTDWMREYFDIREKLVEKVNMESTTEYNIGLIGIRKNDHVFKLKNLMNKRPQPGAACFQADKQELIQKINDFLDTNNRSSEKYTNQSVFMTNIVERPNLCIVYELLMRHCTIYESKLWFLTPEQSIESDLDRFVLVTQENYGIKRFVLKVTDKKKK